MTDKVNEPTILGARRSVVALSLGAMALIMAVAAGAIYVAKSRPQEAAAPAGGATFANLGQGLDTATLLDDSGASVTWASLGGQPRAVFFGFTHCPVVCPVTVWELNEALDKIGPRASALKIQFVSIDPERDRPETLKAYFSGFTGRVRGFTGSADEITRVAKAFEVIYTKTPTEGGDYTMNHTALVFLINSDNQVVDVVGYGTPAAAMTERLERLLAGAEG
jgi:protein SCO1